MRKHHGKSVPIPGQFHAKILFLSCLIYPNFMQFNTAKCMVVFRVKQHGLFSFRQPVFEQLPTRCQ